MPKRPVKSRSPGGKTSPGRRSPATERQAVRARRLVEANRELTAELRTLRSRQRGFDEARANYVELFDFAPVAYALLDPAGVILNVSMAGCRLLGYDRKRILGHPFLS